MQEEVTQKTIALVIKTAKLDANVLKAAMRMYLNHHKQKAQKTHGKTSVKNSLARAWGYRRLRSRMAISNLLSVQPGSTMLILP